MNTLIKNVPIARVGKLIAAFVKLTALLFN